MSIGKNPNGPDHENGLFWKNFKKPFPTDETQSLCE